MSVSDISRFTFLGAIITNQASISEPSHNMVSRGFSMLPINLLTRYRANYNYVEAIDPTNPSNRYVRVYWKNNTTLRLVGSANTITVIIVGIK